MKAHAVAKINDLKNGQMKSVTVDDTDVLLCRVDDEYYAVGGSCPHYGAPLEKGVLSGDRIVCPWHHACFHAKTGALQEPPALDSLKAFDVTIDGDDVLVSLANEDETRRPPALGTFAPKAGEKTFAIIGAGAAGYSAAQALRENDFKGRIVMITYENRSPYDRPNLSKDYLQGEAQNEWMPLRPPDFFDKHAIELMTNKKVTSFDAASKTVVFHTGKTEQYDAVLVATGGTPKQLDVPGAILSNVFTLRSYDDSDKIIAASENSAKVVVVGASFIGMEAAFSLAERNLDVTVVAPGKAPFEKTLGAEIGELFRKLHTENGVRFRMGASVIRFEGDGQGEKVVLDNGDELTADFVVVGIGVQPATDFVHGLNLHSDGSINVDEHFQATDGIFVAGDIARFPDWRTGVRMRIEHWRTAEQQGRIAGQNMAGKIIPYRSVPFFWTKQAGLNLRYVGHATEWDEIVTWGEVAAKDFISFYVKNATVLAAAGVGRDREMAAIEELLRLEKLPEAEKFRAGSFDLPGLLQ